MLLIHWLLDTGEINKKNFYVYNKKMELPDFVLLKHEKLKYAIKNDNENDKINLMFELKILMKSALMNGKVAKKKG